MLTSIELWKDMKGIANVNFLKVFPEIEDKQMSEVLD